MKPTLFSAQWCNPCSNLKKKFTQQGITIDVVDIDENTELSVKYGIRGVPAILFLNEDGTEAESRWVGANLNQSQYDQLKLLSV